MVQSGKRFQPCIEKTAFQCYVGLSVAARLQVRPAERDVCSPVTSLREPVMDATPNATPLIHKLESILVLSEDEKDVLRKLSGTIKTVGPRQDLVREGDRPHECCLILEGFAYRYKLTETGKRQIFSFHIPGDIPDLQSLHLDVMDHSLGTLSACK